VHLVDATRTLAEQLVRAIQGFEARRSDFDVLFIYIPSGGHPASLAGQSMTSICTIT
jgi:hypothetical protein